MEGWLVQIFPAEFGFKWTDHIVDGVRDDDQHSVRNYSIPRWSTEMFSPLGNHGNAEKGNLPAQASDDQIRYYWQKNTIIIANVIDGYGNGSFDLWKYNLREKVILSEDLVSGGLGFWTRNGVPPVFANSSEGDSLSVLFM